MAACGRQRVYGSRVAGDAFRRTPVCCITSSSCARPPEVDIVLVEPMKDHEMSFYNIMRYSTRLTVAQHGFETVTRNWRRLSVLRMPSRHGIVLINASSLN
jgi:hypothetical protein